MFLLASCALLEPAEPDELKEEEIPTVEEYLEEEPETLGEIIAAEENKTENKTEEKKEEVKSRIDIWINKDADTTKVNGTFYSEKVSETFSYTDLDAIIFDLANTLNTKLDEVRLIVYVDGERYLKPTQSVVAAEAEAKEQQKTTDFAAIPVIFTKDEGYIRGVGCDLNQGLLKIVFYNNETEDVPFYRNVFPRIKMGLVTYINKKIIVPLYCENNSQVIPANSTIECIRAGVFFVKAKTSSVFSENVTYEESLSVLVWLNVDAL